MPDRPSASPRQPSREALRSIAELFPSVQKGRGSVATILGGAETGKSRLVAELLRDAIASGWMGLHATATPRSSELPRGLVLDALAPLLPGSIPGGGSGARRTPDPSPIGLPLALTAFLSTAGPPASSPSDEKADEGAEWELRSSTSPAEGDTLLLGRLWAASERAPVLVVLDDAHWMDELSLSFVSALSLAVQAHRVLLVVSFDPELSNPLVRRFALREDGGLADRVVALGARALHTPRPLPPPAPASPEPVEPSPLETILALGAVAGIEFDVATLVEATGRPPEELAPQLEEGARRGWLWKSGEESFHFSGERTWRWALGLPYESIDQRHARIAEALEKLHPQPEGRILFELAHHWQEAGSPARAYPYLVRSAELAFHAGGYEVARERLLRAEGMLPSLPSGKRGREDVRLRVDLAEVLDALGHGPQAGTRLREALARAETLHLGAREVVRIEVLLGDLERRWGHGQDALRILERARVRAASARDGPTEATVLARVAMVLRRQGQWARARESVKLSLQLLGEQAKAAERAQVHYAAADHFLWGGQADEEVARTHIRLCRQALEELHDQLREVQLENLEGLLASQRGDPEEALRLWRGAAELGLKLGNLVDAANMFGNLAEVLAENRHEREAQEAIDRARELVQGMTEPRIMGQLHLAAATLAWHVSGVEAADREIDRGLEVLTSDASVDLRQQLEFLRARLLWSEGQGREARAIADRLDPLRYPHFLPPYQRVEWDAMHAGAPRRPG